MSVKVAIASSDGINIDLHFGQAESFLIYELKAGKFELTEKREGRDWKDPNGYHITINSTLFGYEGTAEIIDHIVRHNYIAVPKVKVRELRKKYNLK